MLDDGKEDISTACVARARYEETLSGLHVHPTDNPHLLSVGTPAELSLPKLGLVNLHHLPRTTKRRDGPEKPISDSIGYHGSPLSDRLLAEHQFPRWRKSGS